MTKRYNLQIPDDMWAEMQELAEKRQEPVVVLMRRFITLGLLVANEQADSGRLHIKKGNKMREVILI